MELEVHPGDEYLASLEQGSLQVMTYMKLANVSGSLTVTPNVWRSIWGTGRCPMLKHGDTTTISGAEEIITYLKEQGFDLDEQLSENQKNEIVAYGALLTDRLLPAILYSRWLDGQNYTDVTHLSYSKLLQFPFTLFYLSWQYRSVRHLIMTGTVPECTQEQRGMELLGKAEECIRLLSDRLGDSDYFFGTSPSSLDALIFGYLEIILQTPLPSSNSLYYKLHTCVNLTEFCKRIRTDHFPEKKTKVSKASAAVAVSQPTTMWRDPTLWISVGVAAIVLGIQGYRVGLFNRIGLSNYRDGCSRCSSSETTPQATTAPDNNNQTL